VRFRTIAVTLITSALSPITELEGHIRFVPKADIRFVLNCSLTAVQEWHPTIAKPRRQVAKSRPVFLVRETLLAMLAGAIFLREPLPIGAANSSQPWHLVQRGSFGAAYNRHFDFLFPKLGRDDCNRFRYRRPINWFDLISITSAF
jgi:hypothetical protein